MPYIDVQLTASNLISGEIVIDGEVSFVVDRPFPAYGTFSFEATAELSTSREFDAEGEIEFEGTGVLSLDGSPDRLVLAEGEIEFEGTVTISRSASLYAQGYITIEGSVTLNVQRPDEFYLDLIVDVNAPASVSTQFIKYRPRFIVDSTELPIISAEYTESENLIGGILSIRLADLSQRSLISDDSLVQFGFAKRVSGAWVEETYTPLMIDGKMDQRSLSFGWSNNSPTDSTTFRFMSKSTEDLALRTITDVVVYNSTILTLTASSFEKIYDRSGYQYLPELIGIPGMNLHSLLRKVLVDKCGFSQVMTNLPNYSIGRYDAPLGRSYYDALKPMIGMFDPIIYEIEGVVWVMDSTFLKPSGMPALRKIAVSSWQTMGFTTSKGRDDALVLRLIHNIEDLSYSTTRTDDPVVEESGTVGNKDYTKTEVNRVWKEFRKTSEPFVLINQELASEVRVTTNYLGEIINSSTELFYQNSFNRPASREKRTQTLVPNLEDWNTALDIVEAAARLENPTITDEALNNILKLIVPTYTLREVLQETESYNFLAYPFESGREYLYQRSMISSGTVTVDSEDLHLGKPFKQPYPLGIRTGNLKRGVTLEESLIKSKRETSVPKVGGEVRVTAFETDHLTGIVTQENSETRIGEISQKTFITNQAKLLLFDPTHTHGQPFDSVEDISFGEIPLDQIIPLAYRKLKKKKMKLGALEITTIGYDPTILPGSTFTAEERGVDLCDVLVKSRRVVFDGKTIMSTFSCTQI